MLKQVFLATSLLAMSLAYGAASTDLSVKIVPAASPIPALPPPPTNLTTPPGAQAAGFTTLAANYDFTRASQSKIGRTPITLGATSNWLGGANCSTPSVNWLWSYWQANGSRSNNTVPCTHANIITDLTIGKTVLDVSFTPADWSNGFGGTELDTLQSNTPGVVNKFTLTLPQEVYYEIVYKLTPATVNSCPSGIGGPNCIFEGLWTWNITGSSGPLEWDIGEAWANGFLAVQGIDHAGGKGVGGLGGFHTFASYNTLGLRVTSDGTNYVACSYWNNGTPRCASATWSGDQATQRNSLKISLGPLATVSGSQPLNKEDVFIQRISIWACPGWATGQCKSLYAK